MTRASVSLPDVFPFSTDLTVRISDINYGGHLGNDAVLTLVQEARIRFLASLGYSEKDIEGLGIIMTDAVVVYRAEAFHGDLLSVDVAVDDVQKHTFDLLYRISRQSDRKEIARVKTGIAVYDYDKKTIGTVPEPFRRKVLELRIPASPHSPEGRSA